MHGPEAAVFLWVIEPVSDTSEQELFQVQRQWGHLQSLGGQVKFFPSCLVAKCVLSSYYKISHILFIYLVGRACIPGIFCWFVLLYFFFFLVHVTFFFFPLKETRPPCRNIFSPRRQSSRGQLPQTSLLWAPPQFLQKQGLVSGCQDFPGKNLPVSEYGG